MNELGFQPDTFVTFGYKSNMEKPWILDSYGISFITDLESIPWKKISYT